MVLEPSVMIATRAPPNAAWKLTSLVLTFSVVRCLKLYQLMFCAARCISSSRSLIAQLADVSVITALLAFPVRAPEIAIHPQAIYHWRLCSATHIYTHGGAKSGDYDFFCFRLIRK